MAGNIQVPNNIEDKTILKRFLTDLVLGINSNTLFSGNVQEQNAALVNILVANPNIDFLNIVSKLTELRTEILSYVEDNLETVILQNTKDVAIIAEQFGTFYEQALAASWYGLSVKAGGVVAGLEIGSLDPDVTTPGDESSYFRVIADNFIVGKAYEDLTQEEKNYLAANNLPAFGTVYNEDKTPIPALVITWDSANQVYKHYFNGIVNFTNVSTGTATLDEVLAVYAQNIATLEETNDGVVNSFYQNSEPTTMSYGDWWVDTDSSPLKAYRYEDVNGKNVGTLYWKDNSTNILGKAYISAVGAQATADGKITTFYQEAVPTAQGIGDMWVKSSTNITYRWNGSTWISIDTAAAINNGSTTISGGKITTNTLAANVLMPSIGGTTVWSGGALVSQNFNGNAVGNIGSPTQGFRLSSNAGGTSTDPSIYGAYIKGGTIEGVSLIGGSVTISSSVVNNIGPVIIFSSTSAASLTSASSNFTTLINKNSGYGFNSYRMCKNSQLVTISAIAMSFNALGTVYIEVSTDNGSTWATLASRSINNNSALDYTHSNSNSSDSIYRIRATVTPGFTISISGTLISSNV